MHNVGQKPRAETVFTFSWCYTSPRDNESLRISEASAWSIKPYWSDSAINQRWRRNGSDLLTWQRDQSDLRDRMIDQTYSSEIVKDQSCWSKSVFDQTHWSECVIGQTHWSDDVLDQAYWRDSVIGQTHLSERVTDQTHWSVNVLHQTFSSVGVLDGPYGSDSLIHQSRVQIMTIVAWCQHETISSLSIWNVASPNIVYSNLNAWRVTSSEFSRTTLRDSMISWSKPTCRRW